MLKLICVGSVTSKPMNDLIKDYLKKISFYGELKIIEIKEQSKLDIKTRIKKESEMIIDKLENELVYLFDIHGKTLSSEDIAADIQQARNNSQSITFIIGGSDGVSDELKNKASKLISFGKITYPHQLFRVVVCEQVYRALSIINNSKYHK